MKKEKSKFNKDNLSKYLDFFNLSLNEVVDKITTEKTKEKTKQEIKKDLEKGKIEIRFLNKISQFFKIDICNFFFSKFTENPFIVEFKNKNSNIPLSIDDKYILRYYQNIREDIAIFDDNKFQKPQNTIHDDFIKIAIQYRNKFGLEPFLKTKKTKEEVFKFLREKIEEEGIYVFKNNKGDKGQKNGLSPNLQGCIFLDNEFPPLILINSDYPKRAQISTLLHEFAHYLLGKSEIEVQENFDKNKIEKWCNRFSYHFMITKEIEKKEEFNHQNLNRLSETYFVSKASFMIRFKELNMINEETYSNFFNKDFFSFNKEKNHIQKKATGGDYHITKKERLSKKFLGLLSVSFIEGKISQSEFAKYVGIKDQRVKEYIF